MHELLFAFPKSRHQICLSPPCSAAQLSAELSPALRLHLPPFLSQQSSTEGNSDGRSLTCRILKTTVEGSVTSWNKTPTETLSLLSVVVAAHLKAPPAPLCLRQQSPGRASPRFTFLARRGEARRDNRY